MRCLVWFSALLWSCAVCAAPGPVVAIGGALQDDNTAIWQRLVALVQAAPAGRDCWQVISIASGEPEAAAARVVANLARQGGRAAHLGVGPRIAGTDAADPVWAERLRACHGVFMTGGVQARLQDTLRPAGAATPLLQALLAQWQAGGVVAGTSAGTAVLSATMFLDAPDPLAVLQGRLREGEEWATGFGLLPAGVVIDQHAVRRGRLARLLPLLHLRGAALGVAVEENSAALFQGDGFEVLGAQGVLIVAPGRRSTPAGAAFGVAGARLHWLVAGDRFELATHRVRPGPARAATPLLGAAVLAQRRGGPGPLASTEVLGEGVLVALMQRLVEGDTRALRGLALRADPALAGDLPDLAFEWQLQLDEASQAWAGPGGTSIAGVALAVVPGEVPRPLFRPLPLAGKR